MRAGGFLRFIVMVTAAWACTPAFAGGGPETTLVVVNDDSPLSKQIANHYVRARGIDPSHICRLTGIPNLAVIGIDAFRERILDPIRSYIREHGLDDEIEIITYSADFPFGVDYDADFKDQTLPQGNHKFRVASLTGLTYLHHLVDRKDPSYLDLQGGANRYARIVPSGTSMTVHDAHGFRRAYRWNGQAKPGIGPDADGDGGYYLCTSLAATGVQGNTTGEVLRYLDGAVASDATRPDGTVYLMVHDDIRSKTRAVFFEKTKEMLEALDRPCVLLETGKDGQDGKVPIGKADVIGLVAGIAGFDFAKGGSRMLPGSIAEHLTSFGAKLDGSGQTKCTEFLRAGAAGSSGAVAEPYALWMKFPLPFLHAHYAEGVCLAEAFYENVLSPYQLLVLGDPLARPFARCPPVSMVGGPPGPWQGSLPVTVAIEASSDAPPIAVVEAWVDGVRVALGPPENPLIVDTTTLEDGGHTLRIVAVEGSDIETRSSTTRRFEVKNGPHRVVLGVPKKPTPLDEQVLCKGTAKGAETVELRTGNTLLASAPVKGSGYRLAVAAERLGVGTSIVFARALFADGSALRSALAEIEVAPPAAIGPGKRRPGRGPTKPEGGTKEGLAATVVDKHGKSSELIVAFVGKQGGQHFAKQVGAKAPGTATRITLTGELEAPVAGLYRLAINAAGTLTIRIHGKTVFECQGLGMDRQAYAAFSLAEGWHPIEVEYEPTGDNDLWLMLGGATPSAFLGGKRLRH